MKLLKLDRMDKLKYVSKGISGHQFEIAKSNLFMFRSSIVLIYCFNLLYQIINLMIIQLNKQITFEI